MGKIEKLKMRDFKSFRKTVIPFVDGFTTVIGPNGSGKSNFLDALLFVLGGGSMKTMRAGRLTDLVHHNSKTGDAEVEITLRNGDTKYTIARNIDKSGTSVFRLNDKRTTRTEIVELLNTLNIPPENHNFVMQGDVTAIIQMTPKQRREVIDEISGISEYNDKKEKAMKELGAVDEKIKEANIILYERKGYLGEIKKERDQALRYKKFEQQRGDLKHAIIHKELSGIKAGYDAITEAVFKAKEEMDSTSEQLSKAGAQITNLQGHLDELNREILSKGEKDQLDISREIGQIKSHLQIVQERVRNREADIAKAREEIKSHEKELAQLERDTSDKQASMKALEGERKAYDERVSEMELDLEKFMTELKEKNLLVGDITQQLEQMNTEISGRKDAFYALKSGVDQARERISVLKLSVTDTTEQKKASDERSIELEQKHEQYSRDLASFKRDVKGFENELEVLFKSEKALNAEHGQTEAGLDEVREKYHSLQSKVATIKHMTGNTASDSVMAAAKNGDLKGIIGKVEDLCSFEPEYANAIQTAAGARMHFIIADDSDSATEAIKWLKAKKLGRTTFIPLDNIRQTDTSGGAEKALKSAGAVGLAIELVKFDRKYSSAFSYVFGDTVIVESIDVANAIGYGTCRMATLDGDLAESSGAVTGGFKHGTLTQQEIKLVDELKAKLDKLEKRKKDAVSELEGIRSSMNELRGRKAGVELKMKEQEVLVNEMESRLGEYKGFSEKHDSRASKAEEDIAKLSSEVAEGEARLKGMLAEITQVEVRKEQVRERMDSPEAKKVGEKLTEMQRGVQKIRDTRSEVIIQLNGVRSEVDQLIAAKRKQANEAKKAANELIKTSELDIQNLRAQDDEKRGILKEKLEEEKRISSSIRGLLDKRNAMEAEVHALAEQRGQLQRQLETKQSRYNEQNLEKAKLETRYSDLSKEFDPNREVVEFEITVEEMKAEIEDLTSKMIKLEPINLKAVEMYDKYITQVDELKDKGRKLEEEKVAVLQMMTEIETRRKEVFVEAYESIQLNLLAMYKEFFPGAEDAFAGIKLENEDDPFEGGLLIEARPAGKQIKHIDSMSGGEKTLTAIAFLFAIQAFKPSPFYVLDEADAALDKENSHKLAGMIAKRSKICQFIVITHNNPVIQAADQIIGISLDKEMASSMVEVNMKEYSEPSLGGDSAADVAGDGVDVNEAGDVKAGD